MLNLYELEQLVAFADSGRLSKAAENLSLSQPTITRTMQRLEYEFGVSLFHRSKNRISLNETGWKAADHARQLLRDADRAVREVRAFDQSLRTITVTSCAPAPLWDLLPALSEEFPGMTAASSIKTVPAVLEDLRSGACQLAILPEHTEWEGFSCIPFLRENLFICVPSGHALSGFQKLSFAELNGYNFLLASKLGFWDDLCRKKMPASRFLVQPDPFALEELIRESLLPCFVTNLSRNRRTIFRDRVEIPITDPEANITFHAVFRQKENPYGDPFTRLVKGIAAH